MTPRIEELPPKKLIGLHLSMSLVEDRTGPLWGQFAPWIKEIGNRTSEDKISLQIYPEDYYRAFRPDKLFTKWAAVEVVDWTQVPDGLDTLELHGGLYAVFDYVGSSADPSIFQYIFNEWIPNSDYLVDDRPHFEVLGAKYKNNDPSSEEEIWIPIRSK